MTKGRSAKKTSKAPARGAKTNANGASIATSKPDREFEVIAETGVKALGLAKTHRDVIEPRLPPGLIAGLGSDIPVLERLVPGAQTARRSSKIATLTRGQALQLAHELITAMRQAVHRNRLPVDVQRAYGVGAHIDKKVAKSITSALDAIITRAQQNPDEARSAGIIPDDVTRLVAAEAAIVETGSAQREVRAAAPVSTATRNQAARRVMLAIDQIAAAGALAAAHDAPVRAQFEALIAAGVRKHANKKGPGAAPQPPAAG